MELGFVFGRTDDPRVGEWTEQVGELSRAMMDRWIAFVRSGRPQVEEPPAWPRYAAPERETFIFGNDICVEPAPLETERAMWPASTFDGATPRGV